MRQKSRTYCIESIPSPVLDGLEFTCGIELQVNLKDYSNTECNSRCLYRARE